MRLVNGISFARPWHAVDFARKAPAWQNPGVCSPDTWLTDHTGHGDNLVPNGVSRSRKIFCCRWKQLRSLCTKVASQMLASTP